MNSMLLSVLVCSGLCLIQHLAAIPWLSVVDPALKQALRRPVTWLIGLLIDVGAGALIAVFLGLNQDPSRLHFWGQFFGFILELQLLADLFVLIFAVLLQLWPHGAAVALAAFREGIRQP